jgi:hypothetical protein
MGLVLDEFYKNLRVLIIDRVIFSPKIFITFQCVGVSAATGQGMKEFFEAIDQASKEYYE